MLPTSPAMASWQRWGKKTTTTTGYEEICDKTTMWIVDSGITLNSTDLFQGVLFVCVHVCLSSVLHNPRTDRPCLNPSNCKIILITCTITTSFPSCQNEIHHSITMANCILMANANLCVRLQLFDQRAQASQQCIDPLIHDQDSKTRLMPLCSLMYLLYSNKCPYFINQCPVCCLTWF